MAKKIWTLEYELRATPAADLARGAAEIPIDRRQKARLDAVQAWLYWRSA